MIDLFDLNGFYFGDFSSLKHGIIMTEPPPEVFPERDVEITSVAGRSGDIVHDKGRYKNVQIPYRCAILPESGQTMRDAAIDAVRALRIAAGYRRLTNTYNPAYFRMGRVSGSLSVDSIVEQAGKFTLTFDCKPQRWRRDGEYPICFNSPASIFNSSTEPSSPLITIYGTGAGTVTVGSHTVEIKDMEDVLILDCDLQNAYRQVGNGAPENMNGNIYAPKFPELVAGNNPISWTGGVSRIEIIPRWWTL